MTDFIQSNVTKSRFFELANPIADIAAYEHNSQLLLTRNVCVNG